jgi:predicted deacetylase
MTSEPRYLLRFDDLCPTMNWTRWDEIEGLLAQHAIKPIVAVVPDNRDPKLMIEAPRPDFWDRVRAWQAQGWTIALHGYQHTYVNQNPGLMGITPQSEFAGLSREEQAAKLQAGLAIFEAEGVHADAWIAPSHSFDFVTVALLAEYGIRVISDGFARRLYTDRGHTWIPCQIWDRFVEKPAGVWTVCMHHNRWTAETVEALRQDLQAFHPRITSVAELLAAGPATPLTLPEALRAWGFTWWTFRFRRTVRRCRAGFTRKTTAGVS